MNKFELEERLIKFAVDILNITGKLPYTYVGKHLANQITRSGTSPALNYAEAISAESRKDFVHKNKIVLKELRETFVCLKIIKRKPLYDDLNLLSQIISECNELIAIFVTSIKTSQSKSNIKYR